MDSKRDIRPKLASRLLKDSLVLHCLFRVSLATQHIIGTIIFLKQRKNENKNNVLRIYTRSTGIIWRLCARSSRVSLCWRHAGLSPISIPDQHVHWSSFSNRLATRTRVSMNDVDRTLKKKKTMKIIREKSFNCQ